MKTDKKLMIKRGFRQELEDKAVSRCEKCRRKITGKRIWKKPDEGEMHHFCGPCAMFIAFIFQDDNGHDH